MKYDYEDKMNKIGTITIRMTSETIALPIYRVILNRRWDDDLAIMDKEEREYGIAYSDCEDWDGGKFNRSLDVEYNIDVPHEIWMSMFDDGWKYIGRVEGWWHCRNTGLRNDHIYKNPDYYFNRVRTEDEKNIQRIVDDIWTYAKCRATFQLY